MQKIWENNGTEEIGLVTPTPGQLCGISYYDFGSYHGSNPLTYHVWIGFRNTHHQIYNVDIEVLQDCFDKWAIQWVSKMNTYQLRITGNTFHTIWTKQLGIIC